MLFVATMMSCLAKFLSCYFFMNRIEWNIHFGIQTDETFPSLRSFIKYLTLYCYFNVNNLSNELQ